MSHEIRTPMNAVLGMLDLTLTTPLPVSACVSGRTLTHKKCGKVTPRRFGAFGTARIMSEFASQ